MSRFGQGHQLMRPCSDPILERDGQRVKEMAQKSPGVEGKVEAGAFI
jgi:hypothetical protein